MSVRAPRLSGDPVIFTVVVALALTGLLLVYTSSVAVSLDRHGNPHHFFLRHLGHLGLGAVVLVSAWAIDYRSLDRSAVVHGAWAVALVALLAALFQPEIAGARRWIRWGAVSVQPSEFAKLAVILVAAFQLSRRFDRLADAWRGALPPMLLVGQLAVLVALQPDFGTASMLLVLLGLMAFVAGTPFAVMLRFGAGAAALLAVYLIQEPYRVDRLRSFLDPQADPLGAGFQLRQSLIALGTGGFLGRSGDGPLGTGLGGSLQKLYFLPEPHTDFAFAVLGEELGLVGTSCVLLLFGCLLLRGFLLAGRAADAFGTLLASGAAAMLGGQALVNMAVVVGLLPTKGIPLPFLSAGGSSLVASCAAAGLLLSVSRHVS